MTWYHLDGTECVAGFHADGPLLGQCSRGGGPVTPCPPFGTLRAGHLHNGYLILFLAGAEVLQT